MCSYTTPELIVHVVQRQLILKTLIVHLSIHLACLERFLLENGSVSGSVQGFQRILKRKGFPAGGAGNTRDSPPRARITDRLRK